MTIYHARIRVERAPDTDQHTWVATAEVWPHNRTDRKRARIAHGWSHGQAGSRAVDKAFAAVAVNSPERKPVT